MKPDARAKRVALVADAYVNPPPGGFDGLAVVAGAGWGVIQLPADLYPAAIAGRMLAEVAEQVEEFARHDYTIVVVGAAVGLAGRVGEAENRGRSRHRIGVGCRFRGELRCGGAGDGSPHSGNDTAFGGRGRTQVVPLSRQPGQRPRWRSALEPTIAPTTRGMVVVTSGVISAIARTVT